MPDNEKLTLEQVLKDHPAWLADKRYRQDEPYPRTAAEAAAVVGSTRTAPTRADHTPAAPEATPNPEAPQAADSTPPAAEAVSPTPATPEAANSAPPATRAWIPRIQLQLSRVQRVLLWATLSVVLLLAMYPATTLQEWQENDSYNGIPLPGYWDAVNPRSVAQYELSKPWVRDVGQRTVLTSMPKWYITDQGTRLWLREVPDYARMRLECSLALAIGIGLICALGSAKRDV
jgi:hypothetical protein